MAKRKWATVEYKDHRPWKTVAKFVGDGDAYAYAAQLHKDKSEYNGDCVRYTTTDGTRRLLRAS